MKVLHVIPSFAPAWRYGGPVRAAYELCREQARQGMDVTVFTTNIDGPSDLDVPIDRPVSMNGFRVRYFQVQKPRSYSFSLSLAAALESEVRDYQIVHIHSVFNWPITPASRACRRRRIPYLVRPCGILDPVSVWKSYEDGWTSLVSGAKKRLYMGLVERRNLNGAAAIHYTCRAELENARWARLRSSGFVCPMGVTPEPSNGMTRHALGLPEDKTVVLFLSRLDPKKGLDLLVGALAEIGPQGNDVALAIAGGGSAEYERRIRKLLIETNLERRTIWLGPVEDSRKWALLRLSDVFALPSHDENFGLAVVEALAAGLPVLISDRVGVSREVGDAGAGLIVRCTRKSIRDGLAELIAQPARRREMASRARRLAQRTFGWPSIGRKLLRIYEDAILGRAIPEQSSE